MDRLTYPDIARILGTGLISTGLGLLMFVAITVTWGDPFTSVSAQAEQKKLSRSIDAALPPAEGLKSAGLDPALTQAAAALAKKSIRYGAPLGHIKIPRIGLDRVFVHGARNGTPDLDGGPGIYKETGLPGSGLPIAVAGHRTTHGAPFLNIDRLKVGNEIILEVPYGTFTYTVTRQEIITPTDWSIIDVGDAEPTAAARAAVMRTRRCIDTCEHIVLTACHPKYSAAKRLAVFARLSSVQLTAGAAA